MIKPIVFVLIASVIEDAKDAAAQPLPVLLIAAILILGYVASIKDKREREGWKDFAKAVKIEREARERERMFEHSELLRVVESNTAAFVAFKSSVENLRR